MNIMKRIVLMVVSSLIGVFSVICFANDIAKHDKNIIHVAIIDCARDNNIPNNANNVTAELKGDQLKAFRTCLDHSTKLDTLHLSPSDKQALLQEIDHKSTLTLKGLEDDLNNIVVKDKIKAQ